MEQLTKVFPANDFALLAVIIVLPLLGAFINGVFGKRLGKEAVTLMALSAVGVPFIASVAAFLMLANAQEGESAAKFSWLAWDWLTINGLGGGSFIPVQVKFSLDALSGTMALVVTGIGFLIHLYSTKYMEEDEGYHRFFSYLNLFIFSMLVLILGDNLPVLFVGWEGVGLCSYLLIGFWFEEGANAEAGKKAFVTNRIGDFGLLIAMGLLVYYAGALDWSGIDSNSQRLVQSVKVWPIGNEIPIAQYLPDSWAAWVNEHRHVSVATLVGLALFLGCAGKSAQIPLYVWLPDAMAGPTPVSALIHAATMVTAGVYLVCRMAGVFVLSPAAMFTVAFIGAITALFAATIALVQNDIKKVLAYSTVSQLGYMFLGVGVGAFASGFFHVVTHAFFKACLFLGAGSVIHAMHVRIHDHDASQDMRNMGGLKKYMPYTFATFAAAWAAIVGVPLTSGFVSKDEILLKASTSYIPSPVEDNTIGLGASQITLWEWPEWGGSFLYWVGAAAAVLTAFYMTRLFIGIFFGKFVGWKIKKRWAPDPHGHDHHHAYDPEEKLDGPKPHESPWQMTLPLVILGAGSILLGLINEHNLLHTHALAEWLDPVFASASDSVRLVEGHESKSVMVVAIAFVCFAAGSGFAYWLYIQQKGEPARQWAKQFPGLYALVVDKWRIDELYEETILGAVDSLAEFAAWFDRWVVDGILARVTAGIIAGVGMLLRLTQTGRVHAYGAVMAAGMAVVGWFLLTPHAEAKVSENHSTGKYSLMAAPGFGYSYRWVHSAKPESEKKQESEEEAQEFSSERELAFDLDVEEERKVTLEVKNSFGQVAARDFVFKRPKPDLSHSGPGQRIEIEQGEDGRLRGKVQEPNARPRPTTIDPNAPPAELTRQAKDVIEALKARRRQQQETGKKPDAERQQRKGVGP